MKKIFHKIHLWLSVPFGIFITLTCFSGAMLVFEKEITEWCRPELYFVNEIKEKTLPLDRLLEQAASILPDSVTVTSVTIFPDTGRTWPFQAAPCLLVHRPLYRRGEGTRRAVVFL